MFVAAVAPGRYHVVAIQSAKGGSGGLAGDATRVSMNGVLALFLWLAIAGAGTVSIDLLLKRAGPRSPDAVAFQCAPGHRNFRVYNFTNPTTSPKKAHGVAQNVPVIPPHPITRTDAYHSQSDEPPASGRSAAFSSTAPPCSLRGVWRAIAAAVVSPHKAPPWAVGITGSIMTAAHARPR